MKNIVKYLSFVLFISTTGCYSKWLLFQADAVSMTKLNAGDAKKLKTIGDAKGKWCRGQKPIKDDNTNDHGIADQAILEAQGKDADFIVNVKVYRDSNGCAIVEGEKAKM